MPAGTLILARREDGRLEVQRADDEICLDDEVMADLPSSGDYRLEDRTLTIDASNGQVAYVLTGHDDEAHCWRAVRQEL